MLHFIARKRLAPGQLTVVDATNVQPEARKPLVDLARRVSLPAGGHRLRPAGKVCEERNRSRDDRDFGPHVIRQQKSQLRRSLRGLEAGGLSAHLRFGDARRSRSRNHRAQFRCGTTRNEHGPFDIIGDVHGCCDELEELLEQLGYEPSAGGRSVVGQPIVSGIRQGRKAIFVGDLVDRGPRVLDTLRLVRSMVGGRLGVLRPRQSRHEAAEEAPRQGRADHARPGPNAGRNRGPARRTFEGRSARLADFLDGLISHYVLDDGKLVVAHAGMKEKCRAGVGPVRDFALYGETTGETDEFGLPVRYNWAAEYRGPATVVYGHTPVPEPEWLNHTVNIDTGCVFGGKLTALRYPGEGIRLGPGQATYCEPSRRSCPPSPAPALTASSFTTTCSMPRT